MLLSCALAMMVLLLDDNRLSRRRGTLGGVERGVAVPKDSNTSAASPGLCKHTLFLTSLFLLLFVKSTSDFCI